ncbi:MAG: DUF115 domain-containing protein [Rhabdochlamydiaceae bacterium]|nr:DUF115 domain-containing protein [Rhabdochlamydiaceae bacterium]
MEIVSAGIDWEALQGRFPSIALELCYGSYEKLSYSLDSRGQLNGKGLRGMLYSDSIEEEMQKWESSLPLEGIDVLYVYGIGLGHGYRQLKNWLHAKQERKIIFFEDDLSVLGAFFEQEISSTVLSDLQVHIYYLSEEKQWPTILEECLHLWMSDRIEWTALHSYMLYNERKVRALRLKFLRRSACIQARVTDYLQQHKVMDNVANNLGKLKDAFFANDLKGKFKGIPAVICGAGHSLAQAMEQLKGLDQKALVIAGGSTITALGHYGVRPHIAMAVDPNEEEYERLRTSSCFEVPFLYSARLHKDILSSTHMQMGYLCSNTGGVFEQWMHEKLGIHCESFALALGSEALSITTLATAFARELGCDPILFCGVDLAYSNNQQYCPGVISSSSISLKELESVTRSRDRLVRRKNIQGRFVHTLIKWVMEASCLGAYARQHHPVSFFNLSSQGLPIPGVPAISWEQFMNQYAHTDYDLRGKLHAEAQLAGSFQEKEPILQESFEEIRGSFERCVSLFEQMQEEILKKKKTVHQDSFSLENGQTHLIELDLLEEPAYSVCLYGTFAVHKQLLNWWTPETPLESGKERLQHLEKQELLWKHGSEIAKECLSFLKNC